MSQANEAFCRLLLKCVIDDVRDVTTAAERRAVSVSKNSRDQWVFHGPGDFYWYGEADNLWDAQVKGWQAWWSQRFKEQPK